MSTEHRKSSLKISDIVPLALFGLDHWSVLAYIETRMVDHGGYMIARDARMRTARHNWRIFSHVLGRAPQCRGSRAATISTNPEYGSRLNDGTYIPHHDDWDALQDLAHAGLLVGDARATPLRFLDHKSFRNGHGAIAEGDVATRLQIAEFIRGTIDETGLDLGANVYLTQDGFQATAKLREHKARGGSFATFRYDRPVVDAERADA